MTSHRQVDNTRCTCVLRLHGTGAKDLHIVPWVPSLNDLLGHTATRAFLTHGGVHSYYEAIYHAVPMVVMPIGADQPDNARWGSNRRCPHVAPPCRSRACYCTSSCSCHACGSWLLDYLVASVIVHYPRRQQTC